MKGLIFDVDGVLGDSEAIIAQATIRMFKDLYGIEPTVEDFQPFIGTGAERYVEGPAEKYGIVVNISEAVELRHKYFIEILNSGVDISFPGATDLIDAALDAGEWRLAIATSSAKDKSEATLKAARVDFSRFHAYIHGDMITHKKPDPEIFLTAAGALGVPPIRCVAIEDAITGVKAAKAAGMSCIGVTNSFARDELREADVVVSSLEEVTLQTVNRLLANATENQ
jgi:beta-phosphoglucomutase-like phosphatase (HAD superfamily)